MGKILVIGSIGVVVLLVLAVFPSVVGFQTIKNSREEQVAQTLFSQMVSQKIDGRSVLLLLFLMLRGLFNLLLGYFAGMGFVVSLIILYFWMILISASQHHS
jgi:hypothetical protein